MLDFHTHILYDFDDGPKTKEESLLLLKELHDQGIDKIVSTSHFYFNESIDSWVKKRNEKIKSLKDKSILGGAEVYFYEGISLNKELSKLCVEGTNLLLLEMPFKHFTKRNIDEVLTLNEKYDIVMAHINRYLTYKNDENFEILKENGVKFQLNNEYFIGLMGKNHLKKMLNMGYLDYIGSDCHNMKDRKPNYDKVSKIIEKYADLDSLNCLD